MRASWRPPIVAGLLALAAAGVALAAGTPAFFPANAARGKTLAATCLTCHGVEGMTAGDPAFHVPRLRGQRPEAIFYALRAYKAGARQSDVMGPQAQALSDQDMRDLGAYLSGEGPQRPASHDQGSWAHQKVRRDCTACHGESGMGVMNGVPVLTGQNADYLIHALNAYRSGSRNDPSMGPVAKKLSEKDIRLLAEYFAKQGHLRIAQ